VLPLVLRLARIPLVEHRTILPVTRCVRRRSASPCSTSCTSSRWRRDTVRCDRSSVAAVVGFAAALGRALPRKSPTNSSPERRRRSAGTGLNGLPGSCSLLSS
jgi:hypothetical protein